MPNSFSLGVDIGGTKIHAGLVASNGKVIKKMKMPTQVRSGGKAVLEAIERCIASVWDEKVKGIGVGIAGIVDAENGIYLQGPNFPRSFRNVPLASWLKKRFHRPAVIDNDVHCFTLGEAVFGSGKGFSSVVGLTLGTGIGGGVVIDKCLLRGRNNAAGELGHMTVSSSDDLCGCGQTGHFESLASGSAIARLYRKQTGKDLDAVGVEHAAEAGDKSAKLAYDLAAAALGVGLANIIHMLNPDVIVVGGGLIRVKTIWRPALAEAKRRLIYPVLRTTPILRSSLGDDANLLGAALLTGQIK